MANLLIYGGLGLLIIGACFGIFIAIKGGRETGWADVRGLSLFNHDKISPQMKKLTSVWAVIMIIGLLIAGIGLAIGLK